MPKLSDAIIGKGNIVNGSSSYGMNLQYGGQGGHMMAFGRNDNGGGFADEWMNNHAYVRRNLIPVVISCPGFFQFMPNKDQLVAMYKAISSFLYSLFGTSNLPSFARLSIHTVNLFFAISSRADLCFFVHFILSSVL